MIYLLIIRPSATKIKQKASELKQEVDKIKFQDLPNIQTQITEQLTKLPNLLKSATKVHIRSGVEDGCDQKTAKFLENGCLKNFNYEQVPIYPGTVGPGDTDASKWTINKYPS